jgi:hypothetical protein
MALLLWWWCPRDLGMMLLMMVPVVLVGVRDVCVVFSGVFL